MIIKLKNYSLAFIFLFLFSYTYSFAGDVEYVVAKPKSGEGIHSMLRRYKLPPDKDYVAKFRDLNSGAFDRRGGLKLNNEYILPILVYKYNGISIRSTIGDDNLVKAKRIQKYNLDLFASGIKKNDYRKSKVLWSPIFEIKGNIPDPETDGEIKGKKGVYEIFGDKYKTVTKINNKLKGQIFYLVSGHGGPDPGAIGYSGSHKLCEDEYAYDVILRLGRNLISRGARVYIIVRDSSDGIRDDKFLDCDNDEYYLGGSEISLDQIERLNKRADIVNKLYQKHRFTAKKQHQIIIHVDSRENKELIDIFFYYKPGNWHGKKYAENLYKTIKKKYQRYQPGRGYKGFVDSRDLHMLRKCKPTTVYIELGNIQNVKNQQRLLDKENRQLIADWLLEGIQKNK